MQQLEHWKLTLSYVQLCSVCLMHSQRVPLSHILNFVFMPEFVYYIIFGEYQKERNHLPPS